MTADKEELPICLLPCLAVEVHKYVRIISMRPDDSVMAGLMISCLIQPNLPLILPTNTTESNLPWCVSSALTFG